MTEPHRYRRRVPQVEAVLFNGDNASAVASWCGGRTDSRDIDGLPTPHVLLGGSIHPAKPGDYVVRTEIPGDGYRYFPMPANLFEYSYEPVESSQ